MNFCIYATQTVLILGYTQNAFSFGRLKEREQKGDGHKEDDEEKRKKSYENKEEMKKEALFFSLP